MHMFRSIIIAGMLLTPLHAMAQSGSVGGSGSGAAGATTGTAPGAIGSSRNTGSPNSAMPGPPGTNSLGTAQSSGRAVTTGSAAASTADDKKIQDENRGVDRKLKGICKGC